MEQPDKEIVLTRSKKNFNKLTFLESLRKFFFRKRKFKGPVRMKPSSIFLSTEILQMKIDNVESKLQISEDKIRKIENINDSADRELEDFTSSLNKEAHNMIKEAEMNRILAEAELASSDIEIKELESELEALNVAAVSPIKLKWHCIPMYDPFPTYSGKENYDESVL